LDRFKRGKQLLKGLDSMAISRDEVLHVARLARLELSQDELERFAEQLSAILEAVGKVAELDLSGVEPTAHPLELANVWAEDEPRPPLSVEEALANAPDREDDAFRVPAA
jgi:aspartyl-tRNA(Asn)/glutamyl-tRNA(Gln) amidotransferase subunit C